MKKVTFFLALILVGGVAISQTYNNEWIDYSKTYYKFKVATTGLYRISSTALGTVGLSSTPAENFQLWRNGKQVALFTSTAAGALGASGYIEFWGERNDGAFDKQLYRDPANQLSDKLSLQTDSSTYFLTVSAGTPNLRFSNTANNVAGNTLSPEPYFIHTARRNFIDQIHRGKALVAGGEYIYSSSYDVGETFASGDITPFVAPTAAGVCSTTPNAGSPGTPDSTTKFLNLFVAPSGPAATFRAGVAGSAGNFRDYKIALNNTPVIESSLSQFDATIASNNNVPLSLLASNNITVKISSSHQCITTDRMVCSFVELNYPRLFNFGGSTNFQFTLPASAANKYLEIANFNAGAPAPVLYDLTNNRRYVADVAGGLVRFVLNPSATAVNLVLVSQSLDIKTIPPFQQRNFINYSLAANNGDYLIISHSSLQTPLNGLNQVDEYRKYRASVAGGSFVSKVYDIDELVDQFAYGIKKHPLSVKNFLRYARAKFSVLPRYAMIIGHGLTYADYRMFSLAGYAQAEKLNLIPTFGYPASDVVLASNDLDPIMATPLGRLSALTPQEVAIYLDKVKQYEEQQANTTATIDNKAWMKTVVHVAGGNDESLNGRLAIYFNTYQNIIEDTLYGAKVVNFNKTTSGAVTPILNSLLEETFQKGISLINYFGHSSSSALDYNLSDPQAYNNPGKYPVFIVNGCNAGDLYSFDSSRFNILQTLSEKYVLAPNRGSVGFIASTHFGLENYLDLYNRGFYNSIGRIGYGKGLGNNINDAIIYLLTQTFNDPTARLHAEQTTLHGDPAVKLNSFQEPDYVIEEPQIKIAPNIVSAADSSFNVKVYAYNIGKAVSDSVRIDIKRQFPDGSVGTLLNKRIKNIRYIDSVSLNVPIVATRDKGENKITVTIDSDNKYAESSETNNTATKNFTIYEDELKPVYPYNFAIISKSTSKLIASTANPITSPRQYVMEMDTTELFNSSFKITKNITSSGGALEFDPGITYTDSTVYYWRVAPVSSTTPRWNNASFVYIAGSSLGYNQSHFYQHTRSDSRRIYIDTLSRKWKFANTLQNLTITNAIYLTSGYVDDMDVAVSINGNTYINSACDGPELIFNVFDPVTFKPWKNVTTNGVGLYGSGISDCSTSRNWNFEYLNGTPAQRLKAMQFMDLIPNGYIVVVRNLVDATRPINTYANDWKADQAIYGANNSLYHKLVAQGFSNLDQFNKAVAFAFVYKKNDAAHLTPVSAVGTDVNERVRLSVDVATPDTLGFIASPTFGPAVAWKQVKWRGSSEETTQVDRVTVFVVGITPAGREDTLYRLNGSQQDFNISSVSAAQYPNIRLKMSNMDSVNITPYQLRYWRILYDPVPEGALAPNISYKAKDTLDVGEKMDFNIPFKNISDATFADSIRVNMIVLDKNNNQTIIPITKRKKLAPGDTTNISALIDTRSLVGNNTLYVDVNPAPAQPEQYRFNNFLYKNFFVKGDVYNPLMDVTFDGVHILNGDIVSSKPKILIKLKDEAKFLALDDTSLAQIFVQYPGNNGPLKRFAFGTDTLKFIPADITTGKNEAMIEFSPYFLDDSGTDYYELIVRAKDKSGNSAGSTEYRVRFQVINKPMISNMFNYPNPFTSSTAFVFTITGSEVPQNIRIQVLTVTGKIVKDITKADLGPLHIGRNITEYKWDGTDQYGQKLGNGIYLYRVITNQNGASLEKFNMIDANGDKVNTDKFFNKGYGKMYLMR